MTRSRQQGRIPPAGRQNPARLELVDARSYRSWGAGGAALDRVVSIEAEKELADSYGGEIVYEVAPDAISRLQSSISDMAKQLQSQPRTISLSSLGSDKYRLRLPIGVELSSDEGTVVAHAADFEVWADAEDEYGALDELRRLIVESYEFLVEHEEELGPGLKSQLRRLRDIIEERGS
jgi:hypothetical protein